MRARVAWCILMTLCGIAVVRPDGALPAQREQRTGRSLGHLPLVEARFPVDRKVRELMILVEKKKTSSDVVVADPKGKIHRSDAHGSSISWATTSACDLITLRSPRRGIWAVRIGSGGVERVLFFPNPELKSSVSEDAGTAGRTVTIEAWLSSGTATIAAPAVLQRTVFAAEVTAPSGTVLRIPLAARESDGASAAGDGRFVGRFSATEGPFYSIRLTATAETYRKERTAVYRSSVPVPARPAAPPAPAAAAGAAAAAIEQPEDRVDWGAVFHRFLAMNALLLAALLGLSLAARMRNHSKEGSS